MNLDFLQAQFFMLAYCLLYYWHQYCSHHWLQYSLSMLVFLVLTLLFLTLWAIPLDMTQLPTFPAMNFPLVLRLFSRSSYNINRLAMFSYIAIFTTFETFLSWPNVINFHQLLLEMLNI